MYSHNYLFKYSYLYTYPRRVNTYSMYLFAADDVDNQLISDSPQQKQVSDLGGVSVNCF